MDDQAEQLKLYVWEDVLRDYTAGVMFALAHDPREARELIRELPDGDLPGVSEGLGKKPLVITTPRGFAVWGGG